MKERESDDEVFDDFEDVSDVDDTETQEIEEQLEESDEFDLSDEDTPQSHTLVSKSGEIVWSASEELSRRLPARNIIREQAKILVESEMPQISDYFQQFCCTEILEITVRHTNEKAAKLKLDQPYFNRWKDLDKVELLSFIGLLLFHGAQKARSVQLQELWSKEVGFPIFRATMSYGRFIDILRCLRFDDASTREEQKRSSGNKAEAVREILDIFDDKCKKYFHPSPSITIDEHLCTFKGRCSFKVYIPSKPGKYGIKFWMAVDCENLYITSLQIYAGKKKMTEEKIIKENSGKGLNITTDNFFTSFVLEQQLMKMNLSLVGTMRKNRKEIPKEMLALSHREVNSSFFVYANSTLMVSYVPKKRKCVILLSTQHRKFEITNDEKKLPEVIKYYNSTKADVDTIDQTARHFSVKRSTRRWPLVVFFDLLDFSALNAYSLYMFSNPHHKEKSARRKFLINLAKELVKPQIARRLQNPQARTRTVKQAIVDIRLKELFSNVEPSTSLEKRKRARCFYCPRKLDRKSNVYCDDCANCVCKEHCSQKVLCNSCSGDVHEDESENSDYE